LWKGTALAVPQAAPQIRTAKAPPQGGALALSDERWDMAKIVLKFGLDTMVPSAKDKLIAPRISALSAPQVPDLSSERKNLLGAFVLNFDLSMTISNKHRQLLFNIIRKAEDALDEYCRATKSLHQYIGEGAGPPFRTEREKGGATGLC
jgi:hypothetical protein